MGWSWLVFFAMAPTSAWETAYDFDGDGLADRVEVSFSGGAHCCYTLEIATTSRARPIAIPYELEGGYVHGLDLSMPEQFGVEVGADGVATLLMEVYGSHDRRRR